MPLTNQLFVVYFVVYFRQMVLGLGFAILLVSGLLIQVLQQVQGLFPQRPVVSLAVPD